VEITKTLYVSDREKWRAWLQKHHATAKEIWLIYYKKSSGKKRISYVDALQEALCFGWIDSTAKAIDDEKYAQRFTPRKPKSPISELNKEHVRRMIKEQKMTPAGLHAIRHSFDGKEEQFTIPKDILAAIKKDKAAWEQFQRLPEHYKRIRIAYIGRRKDDPEQYKKRLAYFLKMTAQGKRFGFLQD